MLGVFLVLSVFQTRFFTMGVSTIFRGDKRSTLKICVHTQIDWPPTRVTWLFCALEYVLRLHHLASVCVFSRQRLVTVSCSQF